MDSISVKSSLDTYTKISDKCSRIYDLDLSKINSYLDSIENFYSKDQNNEKNPKNFSDFPVDKSISSQTSGNFDEVNSFVDVNSNDKSTSTNSNNFNKESNNAILEKFKKQKHLGRSSHISTVSEISERGKSSKSVQRRRGFGVPKLSSEGTKTKVRKKFKRPQSIGLPFSYDNMSSYFYSSGSTRLPIFTNRPNRSDVITKDEETFKEYTRDPIKLSENMRSLLCGSLIYAFNILGIPIKIKKESSFIELDSMRDSVRNLGKNTNSGYDLFGRKNDEFVQKSTIHWLKQFLSKPTFYKLKNTTVKEHSKNNTMFSQLTTLPTYIMHRFQISPTERLSNKFETKIRPVWCIPYSIVALEYMFFNKMIEKTRYNSDISENPIYPLGLSNHQLSERVAQYMHRSRRRSLNKIIRSGDFSRFDQSFHTFITSSIFSIWKTNLNLDPRMEKAYNALRYYTCYTPFVNNGRIMVTRKGVCSGSYTTNIRDTLANLTLIIVSLRLKYNSKRVRNSILDGSLMKLEHLNYDFRKDIRKGLNNIDVKGMFVYGDDSVILEERDFFLIHKFVCSEFGFNINFQDSLEENSFFFLGRFWDENGLPWQTESYKMAHIMFRTKWYKKEELNFNISENLDLFRVLSICLPLRDGKDFLYKYFHNWEKFKDFVSGKIKGYYLLKDWPHDEYSYIERDRAFELTEY